MVAGFFIFFPVAIDLEVIILVIIGAFIFFIPNRNRRPPSSEAGVDVEEGAPGASLSVVDLSLDVVLFFDAVVVVVVVEVDEDDGDGLFLSSFW